MPKHHIEPQEVVSPKRRWVTVEILSDEGERKSALALGKWDGKPALGLRWNGDKDNRIGNPQSRGLATWFIVPKRYNRAILESPGLHQDTLNQDKLNFAVRSLKEGGKW